MKKIVLMLTVMILLAVNSNSLVVTAAVNESDIPAFLLVITNGDETVVTNAFYMRDGRSNGNTYLVASGVVGAFADGSYEIYVMRDEYQAQVTDIYFDSSNVFAFLDVEGMEQFEPVDLMTETSDVYAALSWMTLDNNQNFQMNMEEVDIHSWRYEQGAYTGTGQLSDTLFLGAPVVDLNTMKVWGMMYATTDFQPMIIDINYVDIPEEAAIVEGNVQEEVPENVSGDSKETYNEENDNKQNDSMPIGVVVVVIVAIVVAASKNKNKEAKNIEPKNEAVEQPVVEKTVVKQEVADQTVIDQTIVVQSDIYIEKQYQIRGVDGSFKGQIFEVKALMKMGRSRECHIKYEKNTAGISRIHCQIEANREGIILRDLDSTCGTFGCGEKLQPQEDYLLRAGESFWLGEEKQMFTVEEKENGYEK